MRVVIINQYYAPDRAATAQLAADLGADLASRGHEVIAIASARPYAGSAKNTRLPRREQVDGVDVRRVPATALGRGRKRDRAVDYATFLAFTAVELGRVPRPDVILALTTPPFVGILAMLDKMLRGTRVVLWVMDLYPEVAVALGAIARAGALDRVLGGLSRVLLSRADAVVALDDAMRDRLIAAGAKADHTEVIDNWWDGDHVRPLAPDESHLRRALECGERFVVGYFGNLGRGHDFATLLDAIEVLGSRDDYAWVFVGHGPQREAVARAMSARGVWHRFLDPVAREALGDALAAADALYISLGLDLDGLVVPSKLYSGLAAGRPILYVGPRAGRVGTLVEEQRIGFGVRNGDAAALAVAVESLRVNNVLRAELGSRARAVFDARYTRHRGLAAHRALLARVAS